MSTDIAILIVLVLVMIVGGLIFAIVVINNKSKNANKKEENNGNQDTSSKYEPGLTRVGIHDFMEFDEIKDSMIVRKDRKQYVMVIQCQGVNYDLLSEEEKISVEEGFVQFLNILRFPVQLYVQTRSLNLRDITDEYRNRVKEQEDQLEQIRTKLTEARIKKEWQTCIRIKVPRKKKEKYFRIHYRYNRICR